MIRSYVKFIKCKNIPSHKHEYSEILNSKIAEGIERIQNEGGTIISFALVAVDLDGQISSFTVMYEDNGNFQTIDSLLRCEIFNFDILK